MAYTDTTALKRYLGASTTTDDTLLAELIVRAQAIIDRYCDRTFEASQDSTRYFTIGQDTDGPTLFLDYDLAAITSITNGDGTTVTAAQYTTLPKNTTPFDAIQLLSSTGLYWAHTNDSDPQNAVTIVGKWAYSTSAPADIVAACVRLAAYLYRQKDNAGDLDRAVIAGSATILPADIPPDIRMMLRPLRRLS